MDSSLPKGYMGKVLYVDLTHESIDTRPLDPGLASRFFGGRGLGIAFLFQHFLALNETGKYKNAFAEMDPFSEDNIIVISASPTTGTRMPTSGRPPRSARAPPAADPSGDLQV